MKKALLFVFAGVLLIGLTSCGSNTQTEQPTQDSTAVQPVDSATLIDQMNAAADTQSMQMKDTTNNI